VVGAVVPGNGGKSPDIVFTDADLSIAMPASGRGAPAKRW
jgi:hypothetical protein